MTVKMKVVNPVKKPPLSASKVNSLRNKVPNS